MSVEIRGTSQDGLKMELEHGPSGTRIRTAAPRDNAGDGSSFSPTDLLADSLGACMVTTMAIVAAREGIPFRGASFRLEKHMRSDPRRVAALPVTVRMSADIEAAHRARLEEIARTCPVARSLSADVDQEIRFEYV
jgi:putative redox protein